MSEAITGNINDELDRRLEKRKEYYYPKKPKGVEEIEWKAWKELENGDEVEVDIDIWYEKEWQNAEKDIGITAGYIVYIVGAVESDSGYLFELSRNLETEWAEKIAEQIGN